MRISRIMIALLAAATLGGCAAGWGTAGYYDTYGYGYGYTDVYPPIYYPTYGYYRYGYTRPVHRAYPPSAVHRAYPPQVYRQHFSPGPHNTFGRGYGHGGYGHGGHGHM
jgi:hypothetical protein